MSINIGTLDIGVAFAGDTAGLQKATADAQQGIDRFGASTSKAMRQVREDTQGAENALGRLSQGLKGAVIGSSVAVGLITLKNTAMEAAGAIIQAQVQLDKLNNGFKFGGGGAAGGARELAFVREEANRLGLEIGGAAAQYMKMVAAARGTNMEGAKTRELFTSIAEASTVMGMSGEQSERAMQAVVQMMSKGKVQAEELRGQLGEHLPGAFSIAARAMGVTEVELNKLMETGQVMSADFLPKFAAQLRNELGGSVEDATKSMQASLNRYETAWLNFKQNVAQSGVSDAMGGQINILSDAFNGISERMEAARKAGGGFWSQTAAGAGGVAAFLNPINALSYSAVSLQGQLEQAKTKLNELEKERPYSGNIFLGPAIEETKQLIAELERAKAARDQLARQPGTGASEVRYSAMVDDAALASQREKAKAYAEFWEKNAGPQAQFAAAVIAAKKAMGEFFTPETEANIRERLIKPTREAKEKLDDLTKSAMRGQTLFGDLTATEGGLSKDFAEKWNDLSAAYAKTYINAEQLLAAQAALLSLQPFHKKAVDDEEKALKEQAKATAEAAKAYDAYYDAVQKNTDTLQGNIQSENDAAAAIGLSAIAIAELEAVKLQDMATSKERAALTWESIDLSGEMTAKLRAEAKALRDLAAAKVNRANKDTAYDEAQKAAEAWKKASEQIEKDITDALMRGFESGKGFAEVLRDTISNMFKTLVLRPVVSAIVSPVAGAITGSLGLAGSANAATSAASGVSMLGTLAGGASAFGAGASAGFGALLNGGLTEAVTTGVSAAFTGGTLGSTMAGLGVVAGAVGPLIAVAALIKSLDDSGTFHTGGLGSYSAAGGMATGDAVKGQGLDFGLASKDYQSSTQQASVQMAQAVVGLLDSTATTFGSKAGAYAATAFADDTSKDGAWGALMVKIGDQMVIDWKNGTDKWPGREFSNGEAGAKEYASAVATDVRDYLITQTPDWADAMLSALGDTPTLENLSAVVAQINAAAAAMTGMGKASTAFAGMSEAAASALITAMGGAEAAVANLSGYYTNFYSESERAGIATADLTKQLADMGKELPTSREAFRALVDAAVAAGDTKLAAGLISLQDEFAALTPAAEKASTAVSSVLTSLQGTTKSLQREIIELQGGDLRAFDTQGFTATEVQAYDLNASLTTLRDGLKAAKTSATETAATQQQAAADTLSAWKSAQQSMAQGWLEGAQTLENVRYESAQRELDAARQAASAIASARTSAVQASIEAVRGIAGALTNAREALTGAASQPLTTTSYRTARGLIDQAAATGNLNQSGLEDALRVVSGNTQTLFGRFEDWAMAQAAAAEPVAKLDAQAQGQMAAAQAIIATLKAQEDEAALRYDENKRVLGDNHNAMMDSLQMQYEAQIAQIEATQSVAAAMGPFITAITSSASSGGGGQTAASERANYAQLTAAISGLANQLGITYGQAEVMMQTGKAPSGVGNSSYIGQGINATAPIGSAQDLANRAAYEAGQKFETTYNPGGGYDLSKTLQSYKDMFPAGSFGSNYSVSGFQSYMNAVGYNAQGAEATELLKKWGAAMGLPAYAVGTPYVPEDGPAFLHKGEMVVPAAYNPNATGYSTSGSNAEIVAELRAVRAELEAIKSATTATAGFTAGTDRKLARVIKADAISTEAVA